MGRGAVIILQYQTHMQEAEPTQCPTPAEPAHPRSAQLLRIVGMILCMS